MRFLQILIGFETLLLPVFIHSGDTNHQFLQNIYKNMGKRVLLVITLQCYLQEIKILFWPEYFLEAETTGM